MLKFNRVHKGRCTPGLCSFLEVVSLFCCMQLALDVVAYLQYRPKLLDLVADTVVKALVTPCYTWQNPAHFINLESFVALNRTYGHLSLLFCHHVVYCSFDLLRALDKCFLCRQSCWRIEQGRYTGWN